MTEIDTGIELSLEEREAMAQSILAKIEDTNQQCPLRAKGGLTFLFCAELDSAPSRLYNRYMSLDDMMLKKEIADLLNKESYRIWDSAKVIKNQDYHDGLVKGLKMASEFVAKL